ncbi:hypothetical protein RhiJN_04431 [Ceratobasidium sp. AG-Ba]|nr:hypothetical protein RhiJN_04431 [Ceratobasidium sp. AG-Ba]
MVNWSDPHIIEVQAGAFVKILLVLLGLYAWEFLESLSFDYSLFVKWRDFKVRQAVYLTCRYSILLALIMLNVATSITYKVDCQALYIIIQIFGNIAIGAASGLLMLRAIAIWSRSKYIIGGLAVIALGHWTILFINIVTVRSRWEPALNTCVVVGTTNKLLRMVYTYTMGFDFIVLVVSTVGLMRSGGRQGSDLWKLLFHDGIVYFVVAFLGNTVASVFALLHLNPPMDIMFSVPAATFSCIVACRAVRRLSEWANQEVYISQSRSGSAGRKPEVPRPGVHVEMFTVQNTETFYSVDRPVRPTTIDLENNLSILDDDITSQHKNTSQKTLSPL